MDFCIDGFRSDDAEGIVNLFHTVYGENYPIRLFYSPGELIAANRDGRCHSVVARSDTGKIIGVSHNYRSAPYHGLYENGAAIVIREYRNTKAFTGISAYLLNELTPMHRHMEEVWAETVCNHVISQKMSIPFGFVDTAIEVALIPPESFSREKIATGRVATVNCFRCYVPKLHRIFLPPVYEAVLKSIYGRLDDKRDIAIADEIFPVGRSTIAEMSIFNFAQVARIHASETGVDFSDAISNLEDRARKEQTIIFQVILNLTEPWVGKAVDILRSRGYFFGGAMPRWFDGDGLLMQKLDCSPNFENIVLFLDSSKELLIFIRQDWERTTGQ